jgi:hypothetical protein
MQAKPSNKQAGGIARSAALTPEQRSNIARKGALKRAGVLSATHVGSINLAGGEIPCAVLEDGRRVVWEREVIGLLTGNKKGGIARYFSPENLSDFVPIKFKGAEISQVTIPFEMGGKKAHGFEAEDIVDICKMYLDARNAKKLLVSQIGLAAQAEIVVLSLAKIGITALIDEATGYQEVRDRKALQALLDRYLLKEYAAWAKKFPDSFYKEMFRLKGWTYPVIGGSKPSVVGKYTNDLVYERLAPGLLKELETLNPKNEGRRKSKHHQWLSEDVGNPALTNHLHAVIGFLTASDSWEQAIRLMDRAFPKKGTTLPLLTD